MSPFHMVRDSNDYPTQRRSCSRAASLLGGLYLLAAAVWGVCCPSAHAQVAVAGTSAGSAEPEFCDAPATKAIVGPLEQEFVCDRRSVDNVIGNASRASGTGADMNDKTSAEKLPRLKKNICILEQIYKEQNNCPRLHCVLSDLYLEFVSLSDKVEDDQRTSEPGSAATPSADARRAARQLAETRGLVYGEKCAGDAGNTPDIRSAAAMKLPRRSEARRVSVLKGVGGTFLGLGIAALGVSIGLSAVDGHLTGSNDCFANGLPGPCVYNFLPIYAAGYGFSALSLGTGIVLLTLGYKLDRDYHRETYPGKK